ncbi:hypothetical protein, partial [uncultured Novosphingobium sp.]|uniref:hypothetical protein n=1 Tax=uncultured Novosphingobium sp. TaxID=292277 RepID=UPI0037482B0E
MELPADAQIDPIPEGFEELPADAQLQPAQMSPADIRGRIDALIRQKVPRADIDAFLQSQGIDPAAVTGLDAAMAAARQGRDFGVRTVNETPEATAAPETAGQALYRGVGDVAAGVGDLLGIIGNPLNAGINYLTGSNLSTDLGETFRDWTGAPDPITDTERYLSAGARGAAAGLAGAGVGSLAGGAGGMTGYVARQVASSPAVDAVSGMTSGLGAEGGRDVAGTPGAIVGGLAGGLGGGLAAARAFATRIPAAVAVGRDGRLTPEAHELAMRAGVSEGEALDAYARARVSANRDTRSPAERQAAREAVRNRPRDIEGDATQPARPKQDAPVAPDLNARTDAIMGGIAERLSQAADTPPPTTPQGRYAEAASEDINLSRGQAEQDFQIQNDENSLRVSATNEGEQARGFFRQQQDQIQNAITRFRNAFGPDAGNAADRGQQVKEAVRALRDAGQEGVSRLYRLAEEAGGEALPLETDGIRNAATDVLIDELVPSGVKKS